MFYFFYFLFSFSPAVVDQCKNDKFKFNSKKGYKRAAIDLAEIISKLIYIPRQKSNYPIINRTHTHTHNDTYEISSLQFYNFIQIYIWRTATATTITKKNREVTKNTFPIAINVSVSIKTNSAHTKRLALREGRDKQTKQNKQIFNTSNTICAFGHNSMKINCRNIKNELCSWFFVFSIFEHLWCMHLCKIWWSAPRLSTPHSWTDLLMFGQMTCRYFDDRIVLNTYCIAN